MSLLHDALNVIEELIEWEVAMGGFEAPAWKAAKRLRRSLVSAETETYVTCADCGASVHHNDATCVYTCTTCTPE